MPPLLKIFLFFCSPCHLIVKGMNQDKEGEKDMYFTFTTARFTETDYARFQAIHGFTVRDSHAAGERNRGRLILADGLLLPDMDAVRAAMPDGYILSESEEAHTAGILQPKEENESVENIAETSTISDAAVSSASADVSIPASATRADAVRRTIAARGAQAGLSLLSDFTVMGILTKSAEIFPLLQEILAAAAADDYASCNILDIYKGIPKLRVMYWDDEKKREQLQQQFDHLCSGTITLSDIKNPYDALYQKGMAALLHIQIRP